MESNLGVKKELRVKLTALQIEERALKMMRVRLLHMSRNLGLDRYRLEAAAKELRERQDPPPRG